MKLLKIFLISFTILQTAQAGRMFDDEAGRFISRDPLGYVDGMSLYGGYFAERFAMDPEGLNSKITKHPLQIINSWANAAQHFNAFRVAGIDRLRIPRYTNATGGRSGFNMAYQMTLERSGEGCPRGCIRIRLLDNKWDDVTIWGFVIRATMNDRGDPENRPNRVRTAIQHEQQHMDQYEQWFKIREAAVKIFIHGKCEPRKTANKRAEIVESIWSTAAALEGYQQQQLEVEDYENDTSSRDESRIDYVNERTNLIQVIFGNY